MFKNEKSQTAIEFLILIGFVMFIFTLFFIALQINMSDEIKENQRNNLEEIGLSVQNEIRLAHESMEGYKRKFSIPNNLNGREYKINVTGRMIYLRTTDGETALSLLIQNVTGDVLIGENEIKKENKEVMLNV